MRGLRVCMLIDVWAPVYGGGTVHVLELAKSLVKNHGCEVDIYTRKLKDEYGKPYVKDESLLDGRIRIHRKGVATSYASVLGRMLYTLTAPFGVKGDCDVIHAHAYYAAYPAKIIQALKRKPLVYTVHGVALKARKEMDKGILSRIKSFMEDATLFKMRYDCEISVDSSILEYENVNSNIKVIPNGVDTEKFDVLETKKTEKFKVLYVGRFHPQKGLKYLVESARDVLRKHPEAEFHLVGSGPTYEEIKEWVEVHELSSHFMFRGEIFGEDLILEYKSANLFVLPSIYEGQPLTILEAWAAKLPVVATDVGGNKDFVKDGVNGYIIKPKNPKEISDAINKAIENPGLGKMGEAGYALVKENYTWDAMAEKTYGVYTELRRRRK